MLGDERRQMGATGDFMVLDRGSDHGLRAGQRLTIFRQTAGGMGPIARRRRRRPRMLVSAETRGPHRHVDATRCYVGDLVAIHR